MCMDKFAEHMEREWEEHCRNIPNQVLVEMTDCGRSKMAWILSRVASTVIIKRRKVGASHFQWRMVEYLTKYLNEINRDRN